MYVYCINKNYCKVTKLLLITLLLFSSASFAFKIADYKNGFLQVEKLLQRAKNITPQRLSNTDVAVVDKYTKVQYEIDGTSIVIDDTCCKILTEKGRQDMRTVLGSYNETYGTSDFSLIQVIKKNGKVINIDIAKNKTVMIDNSAMSANIYDTSSKKIVINLTDIEIGDMIRHVCWDKYTKARVTNTWSDYKVFEYSSYIGHITYEVYAPKEMPLRSIALQDEIPGKCKYSKKEQGDRIVYKWEVEDIPRVFPEPDMPKTYTVVQRLLISTIAKWEDISKWYWKLAKPHMTVTPEIQAKVKELTKGLQKRDEKIRTLFAFVSQKIRYMGIIAESGSPGYEPHDVKLTFDKRCGVCRDKAALLAVMLRCAGIKAFPVLINNGPKKEKKVPQAFFNHAITAVANDDGTYILMDSTDENTKQLFPAYLCNKSYLVARPEGETLKVSPIISAKENMLSIKSNFIINENGRLMGTSVISFEGINDNAYRGFFARCKPQERFRFFESVFKAFLPGTHLTRCVIKPDNIMDIRTSLNVNLCYYADDVLTTNKEVAMLTIPKLGQRIGIASFINAKVNLPTRKYPLILDSACGVHETFTIKIDRNLGKISALPTYHSINNKSLLWNQKLTQKNGVIQGDYNFQIKSVEFSPKEYDMLRKTLQQQEYTTRKQIILQKNKLTVDDNADAVIIEENIDYNLKDTHNWTKIIHVKKQILTYNGVKENGEIKFTYNPAWERVILKSATVINNGKKTVVTEKEIKTMDVDWVASAARYTGHKIKVITLPSVSVGSIIEYTIIRRYVEQPFFSTQEIFKKTNPMLKKTVTITAPLKLYLKNKKTSRDIVYTSKKIGDKNQYSWSIINQNRIKTERYMPPVWGITPTVWVSSENDWHLYAKQANEIMLKKTNNQTTARKKAVQITEKCKTKEEKILAVRNFVSEKIRHVGPSFNTIPFNEIFAADRTLKSGYGNNTDCAILLYTMLKAIGFTPKFVLASYSPQVSHLQKNLRLYPMTQLFYTPLVSVQIGYKIYYLNDTKEYDQLGVVAHYNLLKLSLNTGRIGTISTKNEFTNQTETNYKIKLENDGTAIITKKVIFYGINYGLHKKNNAEILPEDRKRYLQEAVSAISQLAKPVGEIKYDFSKYPGTETLTVKIPHFAVIDQNYYYCKLPESFARLFFFSEDKRKHPIYWKSGIKKKLNFEITLPTKYQKVVIAPQTINWKAPTSAGSVTTKVLQRESTINVSMKANITPALIPSKEYDKIIKFVNTLQHNKSRIILLKK